MPTRERWRLARFRLAPAPLGERRAGPSPGPIPGAPTSAGQRPSVSRRPCSMLRRALSMDQIPGVRALDLWRDGPNGAVLVWADAEADLNGRREPVLFDVCVQRTDGAWRAVGGASASSEPLDELLAGLQPGLHRLSGSSADRVFLTWALATPEVAMIRLRDVSGRVRKRPPGRHGLVLLGVTSEDPLTHAYAVDGAGEQFPTEPLMLWAPPRG